MPNYATPAARFSMWSWAIVFIAYCIAVCISGPQRWGSPVYSTISKVPGSPYVWGAALGLAGVLILIGSINFRKKHARRIRDTGLWLAMAWLAFFSAGIVIAAFEFPIVAFAGMFFQLGIAVQLFVFRRMDERIGREATSR